MVRGLAQKHAAAAVDAGMVPNAGKEAVSKAEMILAARYQHFLEVLLELDDEPTPHKTVHTN